ncbi:MAG TPA: hypothetical protein DGR97_12845 [Gammaproteobacteria bacterium]|nr:hypothetical protein [Gammaproteobacteria bacterium]
MCNTGRVGRECWKRNHKRVILIFTAEVEMLSTGFAMNVGVKIEIECWHVPTILMFESRMSHMLKPPPLRLI